ncbi:MAG: YeeE/YedE family protein [Gammaproteobacteria bacterium]|nr:YeeE/YedE family protein [Gammaproteobacteria bacterium]
MELSNIHIVSGLGFALAFVFGIVANKTNFCTMGAISDWVNMGLKGRLGAWLLAMGVAVAGTQLLELTGQVDLSQSIYRVPSFGLVGFVLGGLMFGVGMTLSGGCGQRTLVRVGSGNLKSLVVFLILAITAYATLRGIIGAARVELIDPLAIDLSEKGLDEQGLATVVMSLFGIEVTNALRWIFAIGFSILLIFAALSIEELRKDSNNLLGGIVVGLAVVGAWTITGIIGYDDFDPVPVEGFSFVAPIGNTVSYLMTYTGATISFGIAAVFGVIVGSFVYSIISRTFRIETFSQRGDMVNHMVGGALMGIGGVLALGCTVGQGVTGLSTLALGSIVATMSIMIGSAITMRVAYHRMDERGVLASLFAGIADILMPWREWA